MSKRKKKKQMNLRAVIGASLSCLMLVLAVLSHNWSKFTGLNLLEEIEIKGAIIIPADDYRDALVPVLGTSINELDTRNMSLLLESHPFVHVARISKTFPNRVVVEIDRKSVV